MEWSKVTWVGGEVCENAALAPGTYTTSLENIFMDEQKQPNLRFSTELKSYIDKTGMPKLLKAFIGVEAAIAFFDKGTDLSYTIIIIRGIHHSTVKLRAYGEPDKIDFLEIESSSMKNPLNPKSSYGYITLITGLDKLYYITDGNVFPFYVTTVESTIVHNNIVTDPKGCDLIQSRLSIACTGPGLSVGAKNLEPTRIIFSVVGAIDNFSTATTASGGLAASAIDAVILTEAGERFLALMALEDILVVTSTKGIRIVKSSKNDDSIITSTSIGSHITSRGDSIASRAVAFSSFLIFATERTLRAKSIQEAKSQERESIAMELPILTPMESDIDYISFNPSTQTIDCFLVDGSVRSMFFQSQVPSGSYPLSLPMTTSHTSDKIFWKTITGKQSVAQINNHICFLEQSKDFGVLAEGALTLVWESRVFNTDRTKNTFTASITYLGNIPVKGGLHNLIGMWVKYKDIWMKCLITGTPKEGASQANFRAPEAANLDNFNGAHECILIVREDAYKLLTPPYNWEYSVAQIDYIKTNGEVGTIFYNDPINTIGLDNLETEEVLKDIKFTVALDACNAVIGFRNESAIISPLRSHRGKLICKYPDTNSLVSYSTNSTSDLSVHTFSDYGEIDFSSSRYQRYQENKIIMKTKAFLPVEQNQKFILLLTS